MKIFHFHCYYYHKLLVLPPQILILWNAIANSELQKILEYHLDFKELLKAELGNAFEISCIELCGV